MIRFKVYDIYVKNFWSILPRENERYFCPFLSIAFSISVVFPTLGESEVNISIGKSSKLSLILSILCKNCDISGYPWFSFILISCFIIWEDWWIYNIIIK